MNKFELINVVHVSTLRPEDKLLLAELIMRADAKGECFPSVERLCQVRGIRHEKNFRGVDAYLPGLVTKEKRGRKNYYFLDTEAIMALPANEVSIRHTPAVEGVTDTPASADTPAVADNTPAVEGVNTPAVADNTPAVEGANSSIDNTEDSSKDSSGSAAAYAPSHLPLSLGVTSSMSLGVEQGGRLADAPLPPLDLHDDGDPLGVDSITPTPLPQKGYFVDYKETMSDTVQRLFGVPA